MRPRDFRQVDVFTATPYLGNPVAVVTDASGLSDETMQRFARWTNLSETTFLLPPANDQADYRVRIFTPAFELPFAGHPTLGSCHAWLEAGARPRSDECVVQECEVGLVRIRREAGRLAFAAPAVKLSSPDPALLSSVTAALGLAPARVVAAQSLDNGPLWLSLLLDAPECVLKLSPDHMALKNLGVKVGVAASYLNSSAERSDSPRLEVRAFAASSGIEEDPVTGSLNASLAQWLIADGRMPARYVAAQGSCLQRAGRVHIEQDDSGQVWVGGDCVTCISGTVSL